jgi:hypothetical protein
VFWIQWDSSSFVWFNPEMRCECEEWLILNYWVGRWNNSDSRVPWADWERNQSVSVSNNESQSSCFA